EGAVALHACDHPRARIDDAQVMEPRDVDALPDERGQVLRRGGLAARDRERQRLRAPLALERDRSVPCRDLSVPGTDGGLAIPDDPARDPVLDELDPALGDALEVER